MNYQQTLEYLYSQLPMFTRIGAAAFKKDLHNTLALCKAMDDPHQKFKSIHIAGTNGKGSCSHMLAAILQASGYKTGLYTSPHLKDFRERIRINGEMIPEQYVVDFVTRHKQLFEEIQPSFFEMTVALCFQYFAGQQTDYAIIETGLGGRLDSTNVIQPELSFITNIGWDHMDMLGDTLAKIAFEKAGIIKKKTPVVIGEYTPETRPVFIEKAEQEDAKIFFAADEWELKNETREAGKITADVWYRGRLHYEALACGLEGDYQYSNMRSLVAAVQVLQQQGLHISEEAVRKGMLEVKEMTGLQGRWQLLQTAPRCIADTAHNYDGVQYICQQLKKQTYRKLRMVWGMVKDKDIRKILALLPAEAEYYFCQAALPRALDASELAEQAKAYGLHGQYFSSVALAYQQAKKDSTADDLIFIGGSTFVVAEAI